ncbi:hypothetical protein RGQ29_002376 [Quercus rubra]|uniref:Uncharacterized protein n=1 Tax=Quercus rubra TaxID=3512 RepID=A0AAN7E930_QUERU|nr:hypothetical protein RGQ29_002376 [Quercus rubra]
MWPWETIVFHLFWCFLLVSLLYFHTQQVTILIALDHACSEDRSHSLTYKENAIETMSIVSSWRNNLL